MLLLIDNPEQRANLIENVRQRMNQEIEEIGAAICEARSATRSLRRLRLLTKLLVSLEDQK